VLKNRVAVVGIGETRFAKELPDTEIDMACSAIRSALDDAGISPAEVDGLSSYTLEPLMEIEVARNLGFREVRFFSQVGFGGGAGAAVVGHAALAVASGQARVAVAWRSRKRGSSANRPWANVGETIGGPPAWTRPWGLLRPVDEVAMMTRRYMHQYGATRDHLANVALAARRHANSNPRALMRDRTLTRDEYFAARWISEPLCLFDNCLESDGAVACVIVSRERGADCPHPPVLVHAFAQAISPQLQPMTNFFCDDPLLGPAWTCSRALWSEADFGPEDVDVAQLYDAFSPMVLWSLEAYGFCPRGEGGEYSSGGNLEFPDGTLPVNTSGGGLSEVYLHGFNLVAEGVRQIRGTAANQVRGAQTCIVASAEGVPTSALLFCAP